MRQGAIPIRYDPYRYSPKETKFLDKEIAMLKNRLYQKMQSNVGHANYNG